MISESEQKKINNWVKEKMRLEKEHAKDIFIARLMDSGDIEEDEHE